MKKSLTKKVAELIEDRVGFFNGWGISEESLKQTCYDTAKLVIQAVRRAPTKRAPDAPKRGAKVVKSKSKVTKGQARR